MKHVLNTTIHGLGWLFFMWGFVVCMGAAGNCDLGADLTEVVRLTAAGMVSCVGGAFLAWWTA